jgi:RNA polymerase sigma factor (sigma-70 family)
MRLTTALQLVRTAALAPLCDTSDAELLRRFCRDKDEAAFREILRRYEPLVRSASRRLTRDHHAVDDALQSTFLTLARKAHEIRHAEALPSWLYRVARSVTAREGEAVPVGAEPIDPTPSPLDQLSAGEVLVIFDEELDRLPAAHRAAVLLCVIEGNTVEEAARRLGTTTGALRGWLQRGREVLRRRLGERGVELSVALSLLVIAPTTGAAGPVRETIVRGAMEAHRPTPTIARLLAGSYAAWIAAAGVLIAGVVSSLALSRGAGGPEPVPQPKTDAKPEAKADAPVIRDNLPEGAVARIGSPRLRHAGDIVAMAFSPDGRWLATVSPASGDKSVRVWDLTDGTEKHRIPIAVNQHENSVRNRSAAVAFTADGKRLLVLDAHEFRSFDAATGRREVATVLAKETDPKRFLQPEGIIGTGFSPDMKTFAVVRRNGELQLGDTTTGVVKRTIAKAMNLPANTHYSHVNVLFTPNGSEVCVPIAEDSIPIFDTATGESKRSLAKDLVPEYGAINNAAFAADGRTFVAVVTNKREGKGPTYAVSVGDVSTGKSLRTIPTPSMPRILSVSPNGKLLAVSTDSPKSSEVRVLDLETGKELQSMPLAFTPALVAFSPDSKLLAGTCHFEGRVTVWDIGKNALHPQSADETGLWAHFDRRGHVMLNRGDRTVTVDRWTGKVLEEKEHGPRKAFPGTASEDGKVRAELETRKDNPGGQLAFVVKETATGQVIARLKGVSDYPRYRGFADQNRLFVTVTQDDVLTVWDVKAGKPLWSEKYPARAFGYAGMGQPRFDAANRRMVICSMGESGTFIDVWELHRQTRVVRLEVPRVLLTSSVAFSPDGEFVAGGSEAVTCWRVADGKEVHTLRGHAAKESLNDRLAIRCEFSADGRKLLTVDGSGTIRVWEFSTGRVIRTFSGHHGETVATFSPDARAIVGASSDAPIFVWDVYGLGVVQRFDADRVWKDLADAAPATAFQAVRELCASPKEAVALLKEKLKPETLDSKTIDGWVKDLSAGEFAVREKATAELEKQGETIAPLLRETLKASTDAEARQRLTALLRRAERPGAADLRVRRALDALEHLGTHEAKEHLEALSRGTQGCMLTVQAKEALSRLSDGTNQPPR